MPIKVDCKYLKGNVCEIATLIAKKYGSEIDAITNQSACDTCVSYKCNRMTNHVTYSLAYKSIVDSHNSTAKFVQDHISISGVGTECESIVGRYTCGNELHKLFSQIGFQYTKECLCEDWVNRMNLYGPDWSLKFKKQITQDVVREARKRNLISLFVKTLPTTAEYIVEKMVEQAVINSYDSKINT